jgi:hypothetical protein
LNIFEQKNTFQNAKTDAAIGYHLTNNKILFLDIQSTAWSAIQKINYTLISNLNIVFTRLHLNIKV